MLIPVRVSPRLRVWAEVSFMYEGFVYAHSTEDLTEWHLRSGCVDGVYDDEWVATDVKKAIAGMIRENVPEKEIIANVSTIYCIPISCLQEIVDEVIADLPDTP